MSSTLHWKPTHSRGTLSDKLKFVLRKEYGEPVNIVLSNNDLPFVKGLLAADVEGAGRLINLIEKYGEIELNEVW